MRGAVDLICKPSSIDPSAPDCIRLVERIHAAARVSVTPAVRHPGAADGAHRPTMPLRPGRDRTHGGTHGLPALVAIGASTGGPGALRTVLAGLGATFRCRSSSSSTWPKSSPRASWPWLRSQVAIPVHEAARRRAAATRQRVRRRARASYPHRRRQRRHRRTGPPNPHRPSIDVLFSSIANGWGKRSIGILLTGMGDDGADGLAAIHATGALTIAQNEQTSVVFGMPGAAIERGAARLVLALDAVARVTRDACRISSTSTDRSAL